MVISLVAASNGFSIQEHESKAADTAIYGAIHGYLKLKYPEEPELAKCMVDDFKGSKVVSKIDTKDLVWDQQKLKEQIEKYEDVAEIKCKIALFIQSPVGIIVLCIILLVLISLCCCIIRCVCC